MKGAVHEYVISAPGSGHGKGQTVGTLGAHGEAASKGRLVGAAAESRKPQPALEPGSSLLELCCLDPAQLLERPGGGHGWQALNTYALSNNAISSAGSPASGVGCSTA